ncbi:MAG: restriction endonuclease [Candidatus Portnoybacteria bacterium]
MAAFNVINSNNEKEPFSFAKVYMSLRNVGASGKSAQKIAKIIQKESYPGIETSKIHQKIRSLLAEDLKSSIRFSLKEGIRKLGPTGFSFEKFVGEVFQKLGYKVNINQHLPGNCLSDYEIDFVARKNKLIYIGECKYRNLSGDKVHSKDVLMNQARFLDILKGTYFKKEKGVNIKTILVTNEKFTTRSIEYANCSNMDLLGWKHPKGRGLEYLIEQNNLFPITILPSLGGRLKDVFSLKKMMLAKDVLKINPRQFSRKYKISPGKVDRLFKEARILF